mmetsp:Transcript_6743/g.9792  ORF Transcript_6743/g.9792 Transcript_6743/m.9792 type:complete len:882 (+) Transcript_6743:72-2717(+)
MIKLTEPIQTFLLDVFLRKLLRIPRQAIKMSISCFVIGAALVFFGRNHNILNGKSTFWAIFTVVLSGFFLSSRNVVKKIIHHKGSQESTTSTKIHSPSSVGITLMEGVEDFIHLSLGGAIVLLPFVLLAFISLSFKSSDTAFLGKLIPSFWPFFTMVLSHSTYNAASLLVLSFVAAPVHSLLNSGKRLSSTLFVMIWFGEEITSEMILGFAFIFAGVLPYFTNTRRILFVVVASGLYANIKQIRVKGLLTPKSILKNVSYPTIDISAAGTISVDCKVQFKNNRLRICYFNPNSYFDNDLGPAVILKMLENEFGCSTDEIPVLNLATKKRASNDVCLFSLGSILHGVTSGDHVWGTGMSPSDKKWTNNFPQNVTLHAVRGPNTYAVLKEMNVSLKSVGLGDPGFLAATLYNINRSGAHLSQRQLKFPGGDSGNAASEKRRICFIPHVDYLNNSQHSQLLLLPSDDIIGVKDSWRSLAESIRSCDFVASSLLYGIVLADAIGIPTLWFQLRDDTRAKDDAFQFEDYFKTIGRTNEVPTTNFSKVFDSKSYGPIISETKRNTLVHNTMSSFPHQLFTTTIHVKSKKTLVIIMGTLRGGEATWSSMYKNLLEPNSADLALLVPKKTSRSSSSLFDNAKYVWEHEEYEDWGVAIDKYIAGSDQRGWRNIARRQKPPDFYNKTSKRYNKTTGLFGGTKEDPNGSGAVIFLLRVFLQNKIKRLRLLEQYDRFVITRSDHYYGCLHDLNDLDNRYMWVPSGEDYFGITDRHLVCNSSQVMKALDILPPVVTHPRRYWNFWGNPEKLIKLRWKQEGLLESVRRFPRMMFTCAVQSDTSRWAQPQTKKGMVPEGVYLKYIDEYNLTKATCNRTKNQFTGNTCKFCNSIIMN